MGKKDGKFTTFKKKKCKDKRGKIKSLRKIFHFRSRLVYLTSKYLKFLLEESDLNIEWVHMLSMMWSNLNAESCGLEISMCVARETWICQPTGDSAGQSLTWRIHETCKETKYIKPATEAHISDHRSLWPPATVYFFEWLWFWND